VAGCYGESAHMTEPNSYYR